MDETKAWAEKIMVLFDLMPENFRLGAHENEAIIFDYWAGIIGVRALDQAMIISDPERLRNFLIERRGNGEETRNN